jgi:CheY-like chemotaxis protein
MSKRILVVEDQADNRKIIRDMLSSTDYEISEAENGEQALMASPTPRTTSGMKRISHFGARIVPFVTPKPAIEPLLLLEVIANFCQQLARAKRFRHIIITSRRPCLILFLAERIGGDCDDWLSASGGK